MSVNYSEAELVGMPMEGLVSAYNNMNPTTQAGPRTFSTRRKAMDRILQLQQLRAKNGTREGEEVRNLLAQAANGQQDGTLGSDQLKELVQKAYALVTRFHLSPAAFKWPAGVVMPVSAGVVLTNTPTNMPAAVPALPLVPPPPTPPVNVPLQAFRIQSKPAEATPVKPVRPAFLTEPFVIPNPQTIRELAEDLILQTTAWINSKPIGWSYEVILGLIHKAFPNGRTSNACLRWYAAQMRERGELVPDRPRANRSL